MPLWKITDSGPKVIPETRLKPEELLEKDLEEWIADDPSLLGEPLFWPTLDGRGADSPKPTPTTEGLKGWFKSRKPTLL